MTARIVRGLAALWLVLVVAAMVGSVFGWFGDPDATDARGAGQWISAQHPLGTDQVGRDLLARIAAGARYTVAIAVIAVGAGAVAGLVLGLAAGLGPRWLAAAVQRGAEVLMAFPELLLALLTVAVLGPGETSIGIGIAVAGIPAYLRLAAARSRALAIGGATEAARLLGVPGVVAIVRHVLPATAASVSVLAVAGVGTAVASAAGLGFLGLGVDTELPEWGFQVYAGRNELTDAWWIPAFPALAIALTVASVSILSRALQRGAAEPARRRRRRRPPMPRDIGTRETRPTPTDAAPLLEVDRLEVSIDGRALVAGVSFRLAPGECVALVGESGAGKSVTAKALLGLAPGTVEATRLAIDGTDALALDERGWRALRGRVVGLIGQDALGALDPLRRIGAEVVEAGRVHGLIARADAAEQAVALLERAGLDDAAWRARRRPHELSGGQRQRAVVAAALSAAPRILVADEPTTALDAAVQEHVLDSIAALRDAGLGVVLVSHDLAVVGRVADRVLVLEGGRVVEQGDVADVLAAPRHPYTKRLLAAVPTATRGRGPLVREPALAARGVRVVREAAQGRRPVLDGVDIAVHRGETVGLVGPSGAGKTTLARVLVGADRPDAGEVVRAGAGAVRLVDQHPLRSMDPRWRVGRIVAEGLPPSLPAGARRTRVAALLADVGLDPVLARRRPDALSGGQRQRVAIARALAGDPAVLVCDEPVSALDVTVQAQVLDLLERLQAERDLAIVFISHDPAVVRRIAHRVVTLGVPDAVGASQTQ